MGTDAEQFREWNKKNLDIINIQSQWEYIGNQKIKVILGTTGEHGERVLKVMQTVNPAVDWAYKAKDSADAVQYAIENDIHLINFSKYETATPERIAALDNLPEDIIFVAASGNWCDEVTFPANHHNVIAVANYNPNLRHISQTSNIGPEIDMAAPGHWQYNKSGEEFYGTSYAAPVVTASIGIIQAIFRERNGRWPTRQEVLEIMDDDFFKDVEPGVEKDGKGLLVFPDPEVWIPEIAAIAKEEPKEEQSKEGESMIPSTDKLIINEVYYNWAKPLEKRTVKVNYIVLHHTAVNQCTPQALHQAHLNNGWAGIGYHYFVSKDGKVYRGRPWDAVGAHCTGYNVNSVGVVAEGNFETETMPPAQKQALVLLCRELRNLYPDALVVGHGDLVPTACPGQNFPLHEIQEQSFVKTDPAPEPSPATATEMVTIKIGDKVIDGYKETDGPAIGPVRAIAEALGAIVEWNEETKTVKIIPVNKYYDEAQRLRQIIQQAHGTLSGALCG